VRKECFRGMLPKGAEREGVGGAKTQRRENEEKYNQESDPRQSRGQQLRR